jgi:hypothetical protein
MRLSDVASHTKIQLIKTNRSYLISLYDEIIDNLTLKLI